MAQTSCVILSGADRKRLGAIIADRNRPQKHVQRARIILHSDERLPVLEVARRAGASRPAVWRWQQRFAEEGIEGLLREVTSARSWTSRRLSTATSPSTTTIRVPSAGPSQPAPFSAASVTLNQLNESVHYLCGRLGAGE